MSRLELDDSGRIISPDGAFSITYNSPFPTGDGSPGKFVEPAYGMVDHTEVGYEHNVIDEFNNIVAQASAFCSISMGLSPGIPDGHIHQYGPIGKGWMAWTQSAGNPKWRGVEHEDGGDGTRPMSTLMMCSSAALLELFSRVDGFPIQATDDPVNGRGLIFHSVGGAPWGGHDCPGSVRRAQRPTVLYLAQQCRASTPPLPTETLDMDDNTFVRWCYMSVLLRTVDAAGFNANMAWLAAGGSRAQVYTNLCDSPEGQHVIAQRRKSLGL